MSLYHIFKLIIVGDSGIGKTCFLRRYLDDTFVEDEQPTIGVEFGLKILPSDVKLQIWDTAGQEKFRSLTSGYYRGVHGVLTMYDISDRASFNHLSMWLEDTIKKLRGEEDQVIFFLIGNKEEVRKERKVTVSEGRAFAEKHNMAFFEVSAKSGKNVDKVFEQLCEQMLQFELAHPNSYQDRHIGLRRPDSVLNAESGNFCCVLL